jgi:hypothetical protein
MNSKRQELFRIPSPDKTDSGYKFRPIFRVGRIVPFGYEIDPNDPQILLPIEEELLLLEAAKQHLKNYSLRDVSAWLSTKSGRSISHVGLKKRIEAEQSHYKESIDSRRVAKQFRDAYHKARRLEAIRLGSREPLEGEMDEELKQYLFKDKYKRYDDREKDQ